jgi:hypothetical protein
MLQGILRILDARLRARQIVLAGPADAVASVMLGMIISVCPQLLPSSMSLLQEDDKILESVSPNVVLAVSAQLVGRATFLIWQLRLLE